MTQTATVRRRFRGPRAALAVALPGLLACVVAFVLLPHDRLFEPLTLLLAVCTLVASVAWVDLDDPLLVDASFVPSLLAMAFLGPGPIFAIVVVAELGSWCVRRYQSVSVPLNILAVGAPAMAGAVFLQPLASTESGFYVILGLVGFITFVLNDLIITALVSIRDDTPMWDRLTGHLPFLPAVLIDLILGTAAASLYSTRGLNAIAGVLIAIIAFNYMATQVLKARRRAERIAELAASRQHLVAQALDAEERERRNLSERLHDEAIQDLLMARQDLAEVRAEEDWDLTRVESALDNALRKLRATVFDLHPATLEHAGLGPALELVANQQSRLGRFNAQLDIDPEAGSSRDRLLFSVGRELLINVAKHAHANTVHLRIARAGRCVLLEVRDDGQGFRTADRSLAITAGHIGLASIVERIEAVGGTVDIESAPGMGARVRVVFPVTSAAKRALASVGEN